MAEPAPDKLQGNLQIENGEPGEFFAGQPVGKILPGEKLKYKVFWYAVIK